MAEIWKEIKEYPKYSVSNIGRVKNNNSDHILSQKQWKDNYYYSVRLFTNGTPRNINVHRLVLCTFRDKPLSYPMLVRHLDDIKTNNCLDNLEFGTHKDNFNDAVKNGKMNKFFQNTSKSRKTRPRHISKSGNIIERISYKNKDHRNNKIKELYASGDYSQRDLGYMFGFSSHRSVQKILNI